MQVINGTIFQQSGASGESLDLLGPQSVCGCPARLWASTIDCAISLTPALPFLLSCSHQNERTEGTLCR